MSTTTAVVLARSRFFEAVRRIQPEAMRDLWARPRPRSRAVCREWAERWRLDRPGYVEWVVELAQESVSVGAEGLLYLPPTHDLPAPKLVWEPGMTGETRAAFVRRTQETMDDYTSKVTRWAKANHVAIKAPTRPVRRRKRTDDGSARPDDFELLARWVMTGAAQESLGLSAGVSRQAATKQLRSLERRLGVKAT